MLLLPYQHQITLRAVVRRVSEEKEKVSLVNLYTMDGNLVRRPLVFPFSLVLFFHYSVLSAAAVALLALSQRVPLVCLLPRLFSYLSLDLLFRIGGQAYRGSLLSLGGACCCPSSVFVSPHCHDGRHLTHAFTLASYLQIVNGVVCSNFAALYPTLGGLLLADSIPYVYYAWHRFLFFSFFLSSSQRELLSQFSASVSEHLVVPAFEMLWTVLSVLFGAWWWATVPGCWLLARGYFKKTGFH